MHVTSLPVNLSGPWDNTYTTDNVSSLVTPTEMSEKVFDDDSRSDGHLVNEYKCDRHSDVTVCG